MVSYCCVKGCSNNSNNKKKDPNSIISFHAFPSNQDLKTKWLRAIGRPNWVPPNHTRVCSAHFEYDQINYDGCRIRIKDDAFPVKLLPLNSNFEASSVEACRICLDTDVKMYSLRDTSLGTCMDFIAGFSQNFNIDGLPQYICYQCAPSLLKYNKFIEKTLTAQATLLDIFAKNGQITKSLIKKQNRAQLNLKSPLNSYLIINYFYVNYDGDNSSHLETSFDLNDIDNSIYKNNNELEKELKGFKTDLNGSEIKKCEIEENESILNEIYHDVHLDDIDKSDGIFSNDDNINSNDDMHTDNVERTRANTPVVDSCDDNLSLKCEEEKSYEIKMKQIKCKHTNKQDANMAEYFDIIKLSLKEQKHEWRSTVNRPTTDEVLYECDICYKTFINKNSFSTHVACHDPSQGKAECLVCKFRFKNDVLARAHAKRTHSKKFYCKSCPKAFNNVMVAKKHQRWHSGHLYKCGSCPFSTLHSWSLCVHRRRAHVAPHACAVCARAFPTARGLHAHALAAHTLDNNIQITKEYRCESCGIDFASEGARRVHILTSSQHKKKPDLCDPTAPDPSLRNTCNKCGVECASLSELVTHTRAQHPRRNRARSDAYPAQCQICGETVISRKKHWLHVRREHPKQISTYRPIIAAICEACGKGFQNSTKLHLHQLRHGSPTVRCTRCPRMFYDKYALARHACTHNTDKPHPCRICGRAFKLRSNLERHSRVHTDVAPYECTMCGKKFKHSSSVNLHVRTVHYKLPQPPRKKRSKSTKDDNV